MRAIVFFAGEEGSQVGLPVLVVLDPDETGVGCGSGGKEDASTVRWRRGLVGPGEGAECAACVHVKGCVVKLAFFRAIADVLAL